MLVDTYMSDPLTRLGIFFLEIVLTLCEKKCENSMLKDEIFKMFEINRFFVQRKFRATFETEYFFNWIRRYILEVLKCQFQQMIET